MIIDDSTDLPSLTGSAGYIQRDWTADPLAGGPFARAYDGPRLSSDEERKDLIRQRERDKSTNVDMALFYGFKPYHQSNTNYCWANAVVMAVEFHRCRQGLERVPLSAASVAAPITGYRNNGGWCSQALKYIVENGCVPQSMWPANAIDRRLDTQETRAARKLYTVTEYDDIEPKDVRLLIDYLLLVGPAACAAMWWRHATLAMDPFIHSDGSIGILHYNSGYGRDNAGLTKLVGSRAVPDEVVGLRVVTA